MIVKNQLRNIFTQLRESLRLLSDSEYTHPSHILYKATVGQHVRHIIEFFLCLENGYESGIVNYESRKRDVRIETDKDFAIMLLEDIYDNLEKPNINLQLISEELFGKNGDISILTNYYREIAYNLDHAIHHMALIRVAITEVSDIQLPEEFGIASSTMKFRKQRA